MTDCPNAEVRDLLPDLLNDRLDAAARERVETHLVRCADCRAELALLGDLRATTRRTPAVDVGAIVAALPAYRAPVRRSWVGWRVAAAITVVAAGASSLLVMRPHSPARDSAAVTPVSTVSPVAPGAARVDSAPVTSPVLAVTPQVTPRASVAATPSGAGTSAGTGERELAMAEGALTDLSDVELATLLREIETMDALPRVDVENASVAPLSPRRGAP